MAESQHPYPYTPADFVAIIESLSAARFATYMSRAGNDRNYAIALYLYNARLSKAFLFPLHVVEVAIRNAIDISLTRMFGSNWPQNNNFRYDVLTDDGLSTLDKAIERAGGQNALKDQVVATLTFDFWSNLFQKSYFDFWRTELSVVLPNKPRNIGRQEVQSAVREINRFRNRIAHYEPIIDLNATDVMSKIIMLVNYRCKTTCAWMRHNSTVGTVLRTRPASAKDGAVTFLSRCDKDILRVNGSENLLEVLSTAESDRMIVRVDASGVPTGACVASDVAFGIASEAAKLDGMVSLHDLKMDTIMDNGNVSKTWTTIPDDEPMGAAVDIFKQPLIKLLVGISRISGEATGGIIRSHRRY